MRIVRLLLTVFVLVSFGVSPVFAAPAKKVVSKPSLDKLLERPGNDTDKLRVLVRYKPGGMGGGEAVPHIKDIRPDVPVVVTSGYADDSVLARFRDYGFDGVLPKPFAIPDLRRALEEADATARAGRAAGLPGVSEQTTLRISYP